ncbi:TPA: hypothetical protein PTV31_003200 [Clostridium botulinum]|nr:hypothetical protein [Clostridium botulinum]
MLTCQVGKSIIDTFSYKEEKLREWSNKSMLKCPVCNSNMIYCHGDFKIPYFRHEKDSDCPNIYSEGVTQEHLKGVQCIYKWLKNQEAVMNLQLEKWIPEIRQRPDIYFEIEENKEIKKYAIEFQCSPIATKYNERHNLYRLNNINDIWILGVKKYDFNNCNIDKYIYNNKPVEEYTTKTIEREVYNQTKIINYFDCKSKRMYQIKKFNNTLRNRCSMCGEYYTVPLKTKFDIEFNSAFLEEYKIKELYNLKEDKDNDNYYKNILTNTRDFIIKYFNKQDFLKDLKTNIDNKGNLYMNFDIYDNKFHVEYIISNKKDIDKYIKETYEKYKNLKIKPLIFTSNLISNLNEYAYVINLIRNKIYLPYYNYNKIYSSSLDDLIFDGEVLNINGVKLDILKEQIERAKLKKERDIKNILFNQSKILNDMKHQKEIEDFRNKYKKILNKEIILIDGYFRVDSNIRFKFIKNFKNEENFILNEIPKIISNLKNNPQIYLMTPKLREYKRICKRDMDKIANIMNEYGFSNIKIYNEENK